jgi:hypothetical protein
MINPKEISDRNHALDLLRAFALVMMILIHYLRYFISDAPGSFGEGMRFIFESAPVFFFIAFGMTLTRTAAKKRKYLPVWELGIVSLFHQVYMMPKDEFRPDFLFFLWMMLVFASILRPIFRYRFVSVLFALAILVVNLFVNHETLGSAFHPSQSTFHNALNWLAGFIGSHPFGLFPWAFFVFLGMAIGLDKLNRRSQSMMLVFAILMIALSVMIRYIGPSAGIKVYLAFITKWHPTTSSYLALWAGIVMIVYVIFLHVRHNPDSPAWIVISKLSHMLLMGTVVHYYTNDLLTFFSEKGGFSFMHPLPPVLLVIMMITAPCLAYLAIISLEDLKQLVEGKFANASRQYLNSWVVIGIIAIASILLAFIYPGSVYVKHLAGIGMLVSAFTFMKVSAPNH